MAISTAAAIIGGSVVTGLLGSKSAKKAASAGERSAEAGVEEQRRQFDLTQASLRPSVEAGDLARDQQLALLGLSSEDAQSAAFAGLQDSPGQQFLRDRAQKNLLRNASAIGGLGGGNVRSALVQQGVGFAQQDLNNQFGRLGQLAGQGQAANIATGQFGATSAGNIQQGLLAGGQARQSGILNQNAAIQQGIGGVFTGLAQGGVFSPPPNQFSQNLQ